MHTVSNKVTPVMTRDEMTSSSRLILPWWPQWNGYRFHGGFCTWEYHEVEPLPLKTAGPNLTTTAQLNVRQFFFYRPAWILCFFLNLIMNMNPQCTLYSPRPPNMATTTWETLVFVQSHPLFSAECFVSTWPSSLNGFVVSWGSWSLRVKPSGLVESSVEIRLVVFRRRLLLLPLKRFFCFS